MMEVQNINTEINEIIKEINLCNEKYNNMVVTFLTKASLLVNLSNDLYQIEPTIVLNKISLKDYVLNSPVCKLLEEKNIKNYSLDELKQYINDFEKQSNKDMNPYKLALELYENLEKIANLEEDTINYEIDKLSPILNNLNSIKQLNKNEYPKLYDNLIQKIKNDLYLDNNNQNYILQILNDIFNFYLYGNKKIIGS